MKSKKPQGKCVCPLDARRCSLLISETKREMWPNLGVHVSHAYTLSSLAGFVTFQKSTYDITSHIPPPFPPTKKISALFLVSQAKQTFFKKKCGWQSLVCELQL